MTFLALDHGECKKSQLARQRSWLGIGPISPRDLTDEERAAWLVANDNRVL